MANNMSITIPVAQGYQLAHSAGRGNNQTLDRSLRTLFEQDSNIQSQLNFNGAFLHASTYTGTGSAITITGCGFYPKSVKIWNVTDKDTHFYWTQGQSVGTAVSIIYSTNGIAVAQTKVPISSGITPTSTGFTVGGGATSTIYSENGKVFYYETLRAG